MLRTLTCKNVLKLRHSSRKGAVIANAITEEAKAPAGVLH